MLYRADIKDVFDENGDRIVSENFVNDQDLYASIGLRQNRFELFF
jgi:hypothetical protein